MINSKDIAAVDVIWLIGELDNMGTLISTYVSLDESLTYSEREKIRRKVNKYQAISERLQNALESNEKTIRII